MRKRLFGLPLAVVVALVAIGAGAVAGASVAASSPPLEYASGKGAPYLPGTGAGLGIGPMKGTPQAAAAAKAGAAAGKALGKKIAKFPKLTIGYLNIIGGIESADRARNAMRQALGHIGAKMIECDGQGNPVKWVSCGNSLIAQGVNVIVQTGIDPTQIPSVVTAAKAKNIPIVTFGGKVGPGFAVNTAPDEARNGKVLAAYLQSVLDKNATPSDILIVDYPATWATTRTDQLKALAKTDPKLHIVAATTSDPANLIAGTQKIVDDEITADPNLKAIWVSFDTAGQAAAQTVATRFAGKSYPDRPLLVTFHADPSTQALMRKGAVDAVVDNNYDATAWEAVDALAEHIARGTPFPPYSTSMKYPGLGDPLAYLMVTKAQLPPEGQYVAPKVDAVTYFISKWKAEGFGK